jgi:drug/metabolite transporter (DMT)-like permease
MSWVWLAVLGHLANGGAFVIDKILLNSSFKRSGTYAAMIGSLSLLALLAIPFVRVWPSVDILPAVFAFGGLFVLGLWAFFEALRRTEASRVVPVVGSLVPIITLGGAIVFFAERLTTHQIGGFVFLLLATWLLTTKQTTKTFSFSVLGFCCLSAVCFAAATLFGKFAFNHGDFLGIFVVSRIGAGIMGLLIGCFAFGVRQEIISIFRPTNKSASASGPSRLLALVGQGLGALGFILVTMAIQQGSPSLVNALQAVQYTFLVLIGFLLYKRAPHLLGEEITPRVLAIKITALVCTALGLFLII